jgi:dTDP-4-amino-4,6-dideoxygalactose transaminase
VCNRYDLGLDPSIARADGPFTSDHVCHVYAIRVPGRDALRARLDAAGIGTGIHYPRPVHLQPAYSGLGYGPGDFPVSEALAAETLSLPVYPELDPADQDRVIEAVNAVAVAAPAKVA